MRAKPFLYFTLLAIPTLAGANHVENCTIHVTKPTTPAERETLAGVTRKDAETIALANLTRKPAGTVSGDLEVERGCLVWAFEFKRDQKPGYIRVLVDAGSGRFLLERNEKQRVTDGTPATRP